MRLDKFTVKSQEALNGAQSLAAERGNQNLEPEHLLAALLQDQEGTPFKLLEKVAGNGGLIKEQAEQAMQQLQQQLEQVSQDKQIDVEKVKIDAYNAETNRLKTVSTSMTPEQIQMMVIQTTQNLMQTPDITPGQDQQIPPEMAQQEEVQQ